MSQYQIAVLIGSLRKDSFNRKLAQAVAHMAPPEFSFKFVKIDDLPHYNQDDDDTPVDSVVRLRNEIRASHGVLFFVPEYNRSIPGVLKNALDHGSRPWGQNVWIKKPAATIGISLGTLGTAFAQQHLKNILSFFDMPMRGQPEAYLQMKEDLFDAQGNIGAASHAFVKGWLDNFLDLVKKNGSA